MFKLIINITSILFLSFAHFVTPSADEIDILGLSDIRTNTQPLSIRTAPGELLPFSVSLSNFGMAESVDVFIDYQVLNSSQEIIIGTSETVAVETTSSFVKNFQLPVDLAEGQYSIRTEITYPGQQFPAISEFTFRVENKILGLYRDEFILLLSLFAASSLATALIGYSVVRRSRIKRLGPIDYSNIPYNKRVFFELISDTILTMQLKIGDKALEIASKSEGIKIDPKDGRVLEINDKPSKVIANLVEEFEKYGTNVSFSFRK